MADDKNDVFSTSLDNEAERNEPRLVAFLFAEWVSVTKDDKPVVMGVYDRLFVPLTDPLVAPPYTVSVSVYARTLGVNNDDLDIMIFAPDGERYARTGFRTDQHMIPMSDRPNVTHSIGSFELVFTQHGTYWFEIASGSKILGRVPLNVYAPPAESSNDSDNSATDVPEQSE